MGKVKENTLETVDRLCPKGDSIVIAGSTESGKSTAVGFLAKGASVQELMSMREASGKGSTIETDIIVTDSEDIAEDELIVRAILEEPHIASSSDDNKFLTKVLYTSVKNCGKKQDENKFRNEIRNAICAELEEPANDSLAYKIKDIDEADVDELVSKMQDFAFDKLVSAMNEASAISEQRYSSKTRSKAEKRLFRDFLSEKEEFREPLNAYWKKIIEILCSQRAELLQNLKKEGAVVSEDESRFTISLSSSDYDTQLANELLKSECRSKEYLFSKMYLIYRGEDKYFPNGLSKYLAVTEKDGREIHCIRFVDTMGIFHASDAVPEEEAERIMDLIAMNHADKLLLLVNSHVTDTVKDSYEALRGLLRKMKRNISVYIIFTHWDEYLKDTAHKTNVANRRGRAKVEINWEEEYKNAEEEQGWLIESFQSCIEKNVSKSAPKIEGIYKAAITLNEGTKMEEVLKKHNADYEDALSKMISDILASIHARGPRYKVREGMIEGCSIVPDGGIMDIKKLYRNMVVDCKGQKYWAPTVRAGRIKWCTYGTKHDSDIKENDYGFRNLHSEFVVDMRNLAMNLLNNTNCIHIDIASYMIDEEEGEELKKQMISYLKDSQNFGREFAKLIGNSSYEKGFKKNPNFCYQYQRFTDMLQYAQDQYFSSEKTSMIQSSKVVLYLEKALRVCVKNFMDAKCIEVY